QTVSFEIGDRSYESSIVLLNPVSVGDATAAVTSVYAFVNARLDSIAGAIDAGDVHPSDTASTRNFITSARAAIDDAEQEFLAMSADAQEAASPHIPAQLPALGIAVEPSSPSAALTGGPGFYGYPSYATETDGRCTADSNVSNCNKTSWVQSQVKLGATMLAKCSGTVIASAGVGGLIGGLLGGGLGSFLAGAGAAPGLVAGIKQGAALGAVAGLVICKLEVVDKLSALYDKSVNGVMQSVNKDLSNSMYAEGLQPSLSIEAAATGDTYTSGVPAQVDGMVEFR